MVSEGLQPQHSRRKQEDQDLRPALTTIENGDQQIWLQAQC